MFGLAGIKVINDHAFLKHQDEQRRSQGLKPASTVGSTLRQVSAGRPMSRTAAPASVSTQGGSMKLN